jgi:hypothetical protein
MDTYNPSKLTAAPKKVDISLRQLADFDQTGGDRDRVDNVRDNQVLVSLSKLERPKTFSFRYISDILLGGNGITIATNSNGITTISNSGVRKIIAGSNITISPITGVGDVTIDAASSSLTVGTTAITSGTIGRVLFQGTGNVLQQSGSLFWNNTTNRLGIGTSSPAASLHVTGEIRVNAGQSITLDTSNNIYLVGAGNQFRIYSGGIAALNIATNGNTLINTTTDAGYKLDVNGTARVTNLTTSGGAGGIFLNRAGDESFLQFQRDGAVTSQLRTISTGGFRICGVAAATEWARFHSTGNFGIGTTTDAGYKLDVNGTARVKGTGTTSATSAFTVQNSGGTNGLNVQDDGKVIVGRTAGAYIEVGSLSNFHNASAGYDHVFRSGGSQIVRIVAAGGIFIGSGSVNASSVLQADSTTQGFLPPRMTNAQRLAIATPAVGLIVYCTDVVEGLYINKSTGWTFII